MVIDNDFFMALAIKEAWKYQGLTYPNPAVGCVVLGANREILSVEAHKKAGEPHAEVLALAKAYAKLTCDDEILSLKNSFDIHDYLLKNHNAIFSNCFVYTTLEPCSHIGKTPSCASLLCSLGVKKVYIGSRDINLDASGGASVLQKAGVEVEFDVLKQKCDELLEPFNLWMKGKFVFFKTAQRLDGSSDGVVSSLESRKNVHAMRDVCDLLVIGGNTVRSDRPILDARLVGGRAPDVLIISRQKEFDKTIPLFGVEGRKVFIEDNFERLNDYKNIVIEGTKNMFELSKPYIDYYLTYIATNLDVLNIQKDTEDIILWMKMGDK